MLPPKVTIDSPIDAAFLEAHNILCQGASLVREDVFDLAKLVIEAGASGLCWNVLDSVIHLQVPVDKEAVHQIDEFKPMEREWKKAYTREGDCITHSPGGLGDLPPRERAERNCLPGSCCSELGISKFLLVARFPEGTSHQTGSPLGPRQLDSSENLVLDVKIHRCGDLVKGLKVCQGLFPAQIVITTCLQCLCPSLPHPCCCSMGKHHLYQSVLFSLAPISNISTRLYISFLAFL